MNGDTLYSLMQRAGYSAGDIAERLGVKHQQVNSWLRGDRPIPGRHQEALRALAAEAASVPPSPPTIDVVAADSGTGRAMPSAAGQREFDRLVAAAQRAYRERLSPGDALAALAGKPVDLITLIAALLAPSADRVADDAAREIWFRTGRRVDGRIIMGMSAGEIARRDEYAAQQRMNQQWDRSHATLPAPAAAASRPAGARRGILGWLFGSKPAAARPQALPPASAGAAASPIGSMTATPVMAQIAGYDTGFDIPGA